MNELLWWTGTVSGIAGATLIASNVRLLPWGWWLFLISSLSMDVYAVKISSYGLMLLNICFVATKCLGLWKVWFPHIRNRQQGDPASPACG